MSDKKCFLINYLILGEDPLEAAKQYAKDTKKKATKKVKEAAEETSEAATREKRKMISEFSIDVKRHVLSHFFAIRSS